MSEGDVQPKAAPAVPEATERDTYHVPKGFMA